MKKFSVFLCASFLSITLAGGLIFLTAPAQALPVWGTPADLTGTRSSAVGDGVMVEPIDGTWVNGGFRIAWSITQLDTTLWRYVYTVTTPDGPDISHLILEITEDDSPFYVHPDPDNPFGQIETYTMAGNIALPNSLYGGKFDFTASTYTLITNRDPVWGVFAAKGSDEIAYASALATADYQTDLGLTTRDFIARPDSAPIPEPATMLLVGAGLLGLAGLGRKKFLKRV